MNATYSSLTFWRWVAENRDAFQADAPEGHEAAVEVSVAGRSEPLRVGYVQTQRTHPWTLFRTWAASGAESGAVIADQAHVLCVEIRYVRSGPTPLGFTVEQAPDSEPAT